MHFEKFSLNFSSSSFVIRVHLRHPWPSSFRFGLSLPLGCFSNLAKYYFEVSFNLKVIFTSQKMTHNSLQCSFNTSVYRVTTFSSPEAALFLVSTKNHDLWAGPAPEVINSQTFRKIWLIWLAENTKRILCACSENQVWPEVAIRGADQMERSLWGREWRN